MSKRRVQRIHDLVITTDESILISDSGCDQSIVNSNSFLIETHTGTYYNVGGALHGMSASDLELVNDAYTLATLPEGEKIILRFNQVFCDVDPLQQEALFQPHQLRAHGVMVDDCAKRHLRADGQPGGQCLITPERKIDMHFDGWKCYLRIQKPTAADIQKYAIIEMTSSRPYEPQSRRHSRRVQRDSDVPVEEWRARLGFPTFEVTKDTLANTTQMVQTLQAETREYLRDHYKTRVWALRPRRINDVCFSDTFFAAVQSIRGFNCFQLFAFKKSKLNVIKLLKKEANAPEAYEDVIREFGAPNKTVTDNAQVLTGSRWTTINRRYCIESGFTVPHHQHQNFSEGEGGNFKLAILKLLHNTPHAPLSYWCFAAQFLDKVRRCLSKQSLDGRCGNETLHGDTPDISIFRFPWFSPIWYYNPTLSFPQDKMRPGFLLDIADNTGDGFAYIILPVKDHADIPDSRNPVTLVRSVVRNRDMAAVDVPRCTQTRDGFQFFNRDGYELLGDEELAIDDESIEDYLSVSDEDMESILASGSFISANASEDDDRATLSTLDRGVFPISEETEEFMSEEHNDVVMIADVPDSLLVTPGPIHTSASLPRPSIPLVSQTQPEVEDVDSDDEDSDPISVRYTEADFNQIADDVNGVFDPDDDLMREELEAILDHRFCGGILEFRVRYSTDELAWHPLELVKDVDPQSVAKYVLTNDLGPISNGKHRRWARAFLRSLKRTLRRLRRCHTFGFEASTYHPSPKKRRSRRATTEHKAAERAQEKATEPKGKRIFKYGLEVPKNWKDILRIDEAAGNRNWQDAVEKEVAALVMHNCFDFKSPDFKPSSDFQYCRLHFVYEIKCDLRHKARLVCNGAQVDPRGLATRATVVKGISVRLLDLIADAQDLQVVCGDIGNAFIQAYTNEKIYTRVGSEFGDRAGSIALIVRALYGLTTSAERFHTLLADFLRSMKFTPSRFDRDVWMRLRDTNDGFDYICTHVDDFKVVAKDPMMWIDRIAGAFLIKEHGPRNYYLGNDYTFHDGQDMWTYGCQTYSKEAVARVERIYGCLPKEGTPLPVTDCHPEMDTSPLLDLDDHRKFQMLLGMLQWLVTIGRPDLCNVVSSLNRFGACPREGHLDLAVRTFGFIKTTIDRQIAIDHRPMNFARKDPEYKKLIPDFIQDYPDATEELDPSFPQAFGPVLETTILVDSDHAHDQKTRRSLTGLIAFVGGTPVLWMSKRQGAIASSTYAAEFSALRTATEEAQSLRYMLRCLGCNIPADGSCPTKIFGDNLSVIQNAQNPAADLSKKHVAISFHVVREAIAAGIVEPYWLKGKWNLSDIMTKQIPKSEFRKHCDYIFWRPDFHLRNDNRLDGDYNDDF